MVLVGWEKLKIWLRLHNSSNRSIAAAPRIIDNSIENNPHYIDPTISNAPVLYYQKSLILDHPIFLCYGIFPI